MQVQPQVLRLRSRWSLAQDDNFLGKKINARDDNFVGEAGPYFFVLPGENKYNRRSFGYVPVGHSLRMTISWVKKSTLGTTILWVKLVLISLFCRGKTSATAGPSATFP